MFTFLKKKDIIDNSNRNDNVIAFLLGANIDYLKFESYVFIKHTKENIKLLESCNFIRQDDDDDLLSLGIIFANTNLLIVLTLISEKQWQHMVVAINVAKSSTKDYDTQINIITNIITELDK